VRKVHDHAEPIHLSDDFDAEVGKAAAGSVFPDTIAQLVAEIPNRLKRAKPKAVEVAQILNAASQRHAAFEMQEERNMAGLNFFR
jgi:hypothetical protein